MSYGVLHNLVMDYAVGGDSLIEREMRLAGCSNMTSEYKHRSERKR